MRTLADSLKVLSLGLALIPGCDDPDADPDGFGDDPVTSRAWCDPICPTIFNTSELGGFDFTNINLSMGSMEANRDANIGIMGGTIYHNNSIKNIVGMSVSATGTLTLTVSDGLVQYQISGQNVVGAKLIVTLVPYSTGASPFSGLLLIAGATCAPGKYVPTMTVCSYKLETTIVPTDLKRHPVDTGGAYYMVCADDDDGGLLTLAERYDVVFAAGVTQQQQQQSNPQINLSSNRAMIACKNGAAGKTQDRLNVFYDPNVYRGLAPSQRTAILHMWRAWFDGQSYTVSGTPISPNDPIHGYFSWTSDPSWQVEASYNSSGAHCRGGPVATGAHRHVLDPLANIPGWVKLPQCLASDFVLGVKAPPH